MAPIHTTLPPLPNIKAGDVIEIPGFADPVTVIHAFGEEPLPVSASTDDPVTSAVHRSPTFGAVSGQDFANEENPPFDILGGTIIANDHGVTGIRMDYDAGYTGAPPGSGDGVAATFILGSNEIIVGFKGTSKDGHITTLVIITDKREIVAGNFVGKSAEHGHESFSWHVPEQGQYIIGFTGTADDCLTSISAYFADEDPPYNPALDSVFEVKTGFTVCPKTTVDIIKRGDYGKYYDLLNKNNADMKLVYQQIIERGDNAWASVRNAKGQEFRVTFIANVGTVWVLAENDPPTHSETQVANIGSFSVSTGWLGVNGYLVSYIPNGVLSLAIAIGIQKWYNKYFFDRSSRFIGKGIDALTNHLRGAGVLRTGGRAVVRAGGAVLRFASKRLIGLTIGALIGWGIDELWGYLRKEYTLICNVLNFDRVSTYTVVDIYGVNEEISEDEFRTAEVPPIIEKETEVWIPGLPGPVTVLEDLVSYATYTIRNANVFFGGFQMAMGVAKTGGSSQSGFNFYYRVEKAADNSMALGFPRQDSRVFLEWAFAQKTKQLKVGGIIMNSPEIWSAPGDVYRCDVNIINPTY